MTALQDYAFVFKDWPLAGTTVESAWWSLVRVRKRRWVEYGATRANGAEVTIRCPLRRKNERRAAYRLTVLTRLEKALARQAGL